ncbi:unnamed protein product, partial [Mesorhabditis spiculigera]
MAQPPPAYEEHDKYPATAPPQPLSPTSPPYPEYPGPNLGSPVATIQIPGQVIYGPQGYGCTTDQYNQMPVYHHRRAILVERRVVAPTPELIRRRRIIGIMAFVLIFMPIAIFIIIMSTIKK